MKTIIVATNYSNEANNAIKYAAELARYTNSKMVLFNSFELSVHGLNTLLPGSTVQDLSLANKNRLKNIALDLADKYGITVESLTRTTDLMEELDYQVKRLQADLVVMGMKETHSEYVPLGTTTSVIHHAKYPILTVPEEASFNGISKILFAYNSTCICEANKLPVLMEFAARFNAQVQVCHIEKIIEPVTHEASANNISFNVETLLSEVDHSYKEVPEDDVLKGIEKAIKDWNANLLVMVPHKYGFWEGVRHKSKTIKMARRTRIPLLTLPNPESGIQ